MGIKYKEGCLVAAMASGEVDAIAHQANCQNTMNSGVAKAIRAKWPEVYEADCQTKRGDYDKLGSLSWVPVQNDVGGFGPIFNLYGQFFYGREKGVQYTDLDALRSSFSQMRLFLDAANVTCVGLPRLGAGLGGADWEDVEAIIHSTIGDLDVTVYLQ